jgi:chorismate dehydratase
LDVVPFLGNDVKEAHEAVLLIGDKVVNNTLADYPIEIDLGSAWKSLTSLPFVFAVWAAPRNATVASLARRLSDARNAGVACAGRIASEFGPNLGWPVTLAARYLTTLLEYTIGPKHRLGLAKFFELAGKHGMVPADGKLVFV